MLVLPEQDAAAGLEIEVEVVPWKATDVRESWLAKRGLRRPVFVFLCALGGTAAFFLVLAALYMAAPESDLTRLATQIAAALAVLVLVGPPVTGLLSAVVVRLLLARQRTAPGFDFVRSVLAICAGVGTLVGAGLLALAIHSLVSPSFPRDFLPGVVTWILYLPIDALVGLLAGWVTASLAPVAPYRHAVGLGLVLVLLAAVLTIPMATSLPWLPLASLAYLVFLPVFLLGSWLRLRFGRPRGETPAAA